MLFALLLIVPTSPGLVTEGYVKDSRCTNCHAEIAQAFASHGMGRSFHRADGIGVLADFGPGAMVHHEPSGLHYWMRRDGDGRTWMRQFEIDRDGLAINEVDIEAHYAVGSGNHAQTFLHRSPSGELWELPVTWWADHGWDMSPGFDRSDHARFTRQIGLDCIFCHTAYPDLPAGMDRAGQATVYPVNMPEGIGCQRCHGPGALHVDLAYSADATDEEIASAILNPDDLSPPLMEDLCMQCHLQPTSRLASLMRASDDGFFAFRPGQPLASSITHIDFDVPGETDRFEVNHHGYRLRQSACWTGSGSLSCTMCHDPHAKLAPVEQIAMVRAACLECHAPDACRVEEVMDIERALAQDCARCHMPQRRPSDAVHTLMTDHRIQMPPADPAALIAAITEPPPPSTFHGRLLDDRPQQGHPGPAMAEVLSGDPSRTDELIDGPASVRLALGQGLMRAERFEEARSAWEQALVIDPSSPMAHTNLALLDAADGRIADALARLDLLLAARPGAVDARLLRSRLRASGDPSGALEDAAAAAALRTTLAEPLRDLGNQLATAGRLPEAARAFARAEALEPGDASNAYNLGLALSRAGDFPGARRTWRHAMGRNPHDARLMRLSALMTGLPWPGTTPDPAAGLALAQQLVRADPSSAEAISTLAAMQLANGLTQDAGQTMQLVAKVERDAAAVRLMEALLVAQEGDPAGGRAIYEQVRSRAKPEGVLRQGLLNQAAAVFGP